MIRCLAIDDEPLALKQLVNYIEQTPWLSLVAACQSANEALDCLNKESVDAMFVDINMPDLNGLDFVRSLEQPPLIVFTTAYPEYAVEGFRVSAVDYLLKPFGLKEFQMAAAKVKKQYDMVNFSQVSQVDEDQAIFLKTEHKVVRMDISQIRYVEAMSEYLKIYLDNQIKPLVVLLSMKRLEDSLPRYFMRIHRSYIINLKKIQEINKNRVIMDAEAYLPIGDLYRERFNQYIESKFLGK
ncbi:MAG: response regulator transcription factor [Prevotella sp.]|nr:response regulator transcription factor [Prevotella sp.]